ncbi:MAG: hypothetical protein EOM77_03135 [Bacteroidia bacterium]|nr:hypothetical protein [Bacteroidia bacterium]
MKKNNIQMAFLIGEAILLLAILVLEILPYGVTLEFHNMMPDETIVPSYVSTSYFDLAAYGLGDIPPFFIGVLSAVSLPLFAIDYFFKNKWTMNTVIVLQSLVFILSIIQVSYYFVTAIGILILVMSALFVVAAIVQKRFFKDIPSVAISK